MILRQNRKERKNPFFQRVDKPIDTLADIEKEGKFVQHELAGVCVYGRGRVGRTNSLGTCHFLFNNLIIEKIALQTKIYKAI